MGIGFFQPIKHSNNVGLILDNVTYKNTLFTRYRNGSIMEFPITQNLY